MKKDAKSVVLKLQKWHAPNLNPSLPVKLIQEAQEGGVICALFTLQSTAATNQIQAN